MAGWAAEKVMRNIKGVYQAPTEVAAMDIIAAFTPTWSDKTPTVVCLWENAWEELVPFLSFNIDICRLLCTAKAIESINARISQCRKRTRAEHVRIGAGAMILPGVSIGRGAVVAAGTAVAAGLW